MNFTRLTNLQLMDPSFPPEYTRGWVEFFYQKFQINEHVLIPRLETESLVREAIKSCRENPPDVLIDIGTGSGVIPLSILSTINIPQTFAVDVSSQALEVAKENAMNQKKDITFLGSDLLEVFLQRDASLLEKSANILIVTNLPYIKADDWENMSQDTVHEPKIALFGGACTGFELYEKLFEQIPNFIHKYEPANLTILAEMGDDQTEIATKVLTKYGWKFSFFRDLRGIERFMRIHIIGVNE